MSEFGLLHRLLGHSRTQVVKAEPYGETLQIFYCSRCGRHYIECKEDWGFEGGTMGDEVEISREVYEKIMPVLLRDGWGSEKTYSNLDAVKDILVEHRIKLYESCCKVYDSGFLSPMMQVFGLTGDPPFPHVKSVKTSERRVPVE